MTDTKWLDKVNLLLAKAESTEFPEEAEALMAKAQSIMSLHAIDEAMLRAAGKTRDAVVVDVIKIQNPYLNQKNALVYTIAKANSTQAVMTSKPRGSNGASITLIGFAEDVEATKVLFATLSAYAVSDMLKQSVPSWESARAFRISYILAFAARIGKRLEEATVAATAEYEETTGESVGLALVDKKKDVDSAYREHFAGSSIVSRNTRITSGAGFNAGASAADRANLNRGVSNGSQHALSA